MRYTYDLNAPGAGCLILYANSCEREAIAEAIKDNGGECNANMEYDILEPLLARSDLGWIAPEDIGALTDAPILGIRRLGAVWAAWGFMDYQVRSFLTDLVEHGLAIFTN